ncbi:MAG: class I SAM-dependent methyltransferase [Treponema sp.]|nr:class I SAM-dependent methyltransferase [Treponema sp.]
MKYKDEWFNDDEFWTRYAPVMFDEKRWAEVPTVADGITRLAKLELYGASTKPKGKKSSTAKTDPFPRVADLCCGFGRISLELTRRGFITTGVDITLSYLNAAKEDAAHENLDIEFLHTDVRSFKRKAAYDLAINIYNSFGYFEDPADDLVFVKNAYGALKPGAAFIIDVLGKEIAVRDFNEAEWFERAGITVLAESSPMDSWASVWNRWILIKDEQRWEKEFIQRLYAGSELRALLLKAGFSTVEIYGGWDERPYDHHAESLIAVGRK